MTPDERIEKLLNRAGQTISDLPKRYEQAVRNNAFDAADHFGGSLCMTQNFEDYILHLTDVIDRLELALENVCGERDYLVWALKEDCHCDTCIHKDKYLCEEPCNLCELANSKFEFAGVPEDWRVDDEKSNA